MADEKQAFSKNWSARLSFLLCSMIAKDYLAPSKTFVGTAMEGFIIVHRKGLSTGYLPRQNMESFAGFLLQKAKADVKFLEKLASGLRNAYDRLKLLEKTAGLKDAEKFRLLRDIVSEYQAYHVAIKIVSNFLDGELFERHYHALESARKYAENGFDTIELMLKNIAESFPQESLLLSMTGEEFEAFLTNGKKPSLQKLKARSESSAILCENSAVRLLEGGIEEIEEKILENHPKASGLKGQIAFSGKIRGICRVVHSSADDADFKQGEILVAPMTHPDFIPMIKRAAAIVTDGGGILCHAAIVARELKKPCVTGTEIATRRLKTGDLIEVDAFSGAVTKLN